MEFKLRTTFIKIYLTKLLRFSLLGLWGVLLSVGSIDKMEFFGRSEKVEKTICRSIWGYCCLSVGLTKLKFFGKSEKVEKTICRGTWEVMLSVGRIDKMEIFLGKVKK